MIFYRLFLHRHIIYNHRNKVKKYSQMTETKLKTALITGATGFLGTHLCNLLHKQGWQVFALCRNPHKATGLNTDIQLIKGDILSPEDFSQQVPEKLDAVFHTAASTNTWYKNNPLQTTTNIDGTKNILKLAKKKKAGRYIHISSVVVFGIHKTLNNITENMPKPGENSWINYVKTKTRSEKIVLSETDIDAVIINPTHIIGPGDRHNWARLIKMVADQKLPSIPNGAGSFVDVRDVAAGILNAFHQGKSGENYLLGGTDLNFKQFVYKIADKLNVAPTQIQLPNILLKILAHVKNGISRISGKEPDITPESVALISDLYRCDAQKARREIGYRTRGIDETLTDTLDFLKENKLI